MSTAWKKAWRDLMGNKVRTTLVVLSIAVGVFALGLVFNMRDAMHAWMLEDYRSANASHLLVRMAPFDHDLVKLFQREYAGAAIESQVSLSAQWRMADETLWRDATLVAKPDYTTQRLDRIELQSGEWPTRRTLAVEQRTAQRFGLGLGTTLIVKVDESERILPITGVVRRYNCVPPEFGGPLLLYVTPKTAAWLTGQEGLTHLAIRLQSPSNQDMSDAVDWFLGRLQKMGANVSIWTFERDHFAQNPVNAVLGILAVMGALALGLSAFLIINTMSAIIAQQTWQIGVMRTVGATFSQVAQVYLLTVLVYGGLALLLAIPTAAVAAHLITRQTAKLVNIPVGEFRVTPSAIGLQVIVGLLVPVLAALVPAINGARITPQQAIVSHGLGGGYAPGILDRLIAAFRFLPRPMMLSLRNTFRRKSRIVLTLLMLTLSGVMFIAVVSTRASLDNTIAVQARQYGYDVIVWLEQPLRVTQLTETTQNAEGVERVEVWTDAGGTIVSDNGEVFYVRLWGLPPDSTMFKPRIIQGRWLDPEDGFTIVVNSRAATDRDIQIGDTLTWKFDPKERKWRVVGIIVDSRDGQVNCFVPIDALSAMGGYARRGRIIAVQATRHDAASQTALVGRLREALATAHLKAVTIDSAEQTSAQARSQFDIVVYLLLTMTLLAAIVGSIGLMGTLSINIVERTREIGVMRATGATTFTLVQLFVGEGIIVGVLSWMLAVLPSYLASKVLGDMVGNLLLRAPLDFVYSMEGAAGWLLIVIGLSALASLLPALRAARMIVHETLAYE
jgi:putative ABC transport system permease protein